MFSDCRDTSQISWKEAYGVLGGSVSSRQSAELVVGRKRLRSTPSRRPTTGIGFVGTLEANSIDRMPSSSSYRPGDLPKKPEPFSPTLASIDSEVPPSPKNSGISWDTETGESIVFLSIMITAFNSCF